MKLTQNQMQALAWVKHQLYRKPGCARPDLRGDIEHLKDIGLIFVDATPNGAILKLSSDAEEMISHR